MAIIDIFEKVKNNPRLVKEFFEEIEEIATPELIEELEEVVLGNHFNSERLIEAYKGMVNKDGTTGQHWNLTQTNEGAVQIGFDYKALGYNEYDWNFTVNMMYSDYYSVKRTDIDYLELAVDWVDDIDFKEDKPYRYWLLKENRCICS